MVIAGISSEELVQQTCSLCCMSLFQALERLVKTAGCECLAKYPQAHQQPPPEQPPEYQPVRQEEAVTPEPVTAVREDIHDPVERMKENKQRLIAYYKEVEPSRADDVENINKILIEYSLPELTDALENKYGKAPVFVLRPGE